MKELGQGLFWASLACIAFSSIAQGANGTDQTNPVSVVTSATVVTCAVRPALGRAGPLTSAVAYRINGMRMAAAGGSALSPNGVWPCARRDAAGSWTVVIEQSVSSRGRP